MYAIEETAKIMKNMDFRPKIFDQVVGQNEAKELLKKAISLEKTKVEEMKSDFFLYCTNNQLIDLFSHII